MKHGVKCAFVTFITMLKMKEQDIHEKRQVNELWLSADFGDRDGYSIWGCGTEGLATDRCVDSWELGEMLLSDTCVRRGLRSFMPLDLK